MFGGDLNLTKSIFWAFSLLVLFGCSDEQKFLRSGQFAPAFNLERLEGGNLQFPDDLKGKLVIIQFWADWCPPCIHEMKSLAKVYNQYKPYGVELLAVNLRQDKQSVKNLVNKLNAPYLFLLDIEGEVADKYAVNNLPSSYIINQNGQIQSRIMGELTEETFEMIIVESMNPDE